MHKFFKEKFNVVMTGSIIVVLILIAIFALLNLNVATHVRFLELIGAQENAAIKGQQLKVSFSGPMNKDSSARFITLSPSADFSTAWSNNTLYILFKQNLQSQTPYQLKISGEMTDIYNKPLKEDYFYNFKTQSLALAYIQQEDESKKIIMSDVNFADRKTVFESSDLKLFALNRNYLVVVTEVDGLSNLKYKNLTTGELRDLNIESSVIEQIDFSPVANQFIYLTQKVERKTGYNQPSDLILINLFDIDQQKNYILNGDQLAVQIIDIKYSPDGADIMFKTSDGYYNLIEIKDATKQTVLGRYLADGGFNKVGNKIAFLSFDPMTIYTEAQYILEYSADRTQKNITDGLIPVLDPQFFHNDNSLIFAERYFDLESTKGLYQIVKINEQGTQSTILKIDNQSLELPKLSLDDRYVAVEKYTQESLLDFEHQRVMNFQTKPKNANLLLYDLVEQKLIDSQIVGYDLKWVN